MKEYSIGLDLGTSSVKGVLFDGKEVIDTKNAKFTYKESCLPNGAKYIGFDACEFCNTIFSVIKDFSNYVEKIGGEIKGLAFASASGNTLLLDSNGAPLIDAYSWTNPAFREDVKAVLPNFTKDYIRRVCGWGFFDSFPLAHLSHLKVNAPSLLKNAKTICMTTEYVLFRLTGKWGMDYSTATPFYLVDQVKGEYNEPFLQALGITKEQLVPLGNTGDLLGTTIKEVEDITGLKVGTKVFLGSFDHPAGARANGIEKEGDLLLSCGTSWVEFFPVKDREKVLKLNALCDPFMKKKGVWGAMISIACISSKIDSFIDKYISNGKDKFKTFSELSMKSTKSANGLVINVLEDIDKDFSSYDKKDIARALMESTGNLLKQRLDRLKNEGIVFNRVCMAGGPSQNEFWVKVIEDIINIPITVTFGVNSGAVGSAKLYFDKGGAI